MENPDRHKKLEIQRLLDLIREYLEFLGNPWVDYDRRLGHWEQRKKVPWPVELNIPE